MAVITDSLGRRWDPSKHPRDSKGRFIKTFGLVRLMLEGFSKAFATGKVVSIKDENSIAVELTGISKEHQNKLKPGTLVHVKAKNTEAINEKANINLASKTTRVGKVGVPNGLIAGYASKPDRYKVSVKDFAKANGFSEDEITQVDNILEGRRDVSNSPAGAYILGLHSLDNTDFDDPSEIEDLGNMLKSLGATDDDLDDTPDGLSGLTPILKKYNASKPEGERKDRIPLKGSRAYDDGEEVFQNERGETKARLDGDDPRDAEEAAFPVGTENQEPATSNFSDNDGSYEIESLFDGEESVLEDGEEQGLENGFKAVRTGDRIDILDPDGAEVTSLRATNASQDDFDTAGADYASAVRDRTSAGLGDTEQEPVADLDEVDVPEEDTAPEPDVAPERTPEPTPEPDTEPVVEPDVAPDTVAGDTKPPTAKVKEIMDFVKNGGDLDESNFTQKGISRAVNAGWLNSDRKTLSDKGKDWLAANEPVDEDAPIPETSPDAPTPRVDTPDFSRPVTLQVNDKKSVEDLMDFIGEGRKFEALVPDGKGGYKKTKKGSLELRITDDKSPDLVDLVHVDEDGKVTPLPEWSKMENIVYDFRNKSDNVPDLTDEDTRAELAEAMSGSLPDADESPSYISVLPFDETQEESLFDDPIEETPETQEYGLEDWTSRFDELREQLRNRPEGLEGITSTIAKLNNLDTKPQVLSDDEFENYDAPTVYRGSTNEATDNFVNGDLRVGSGGSGTGSYASNYRGRADGFGGNTGSVLEMKVKPDAKFIDGDVLEAERQKDYDTAVSNNDAAGQFLADGDLGKYAAARGYDGYTLKPFDAMSEDEQYHVIINRDAVVVKESSVPRSEADRPTFETGQRVSYTGDDGVEYPAEVIRSDADGTRIRLPAGEEIDLSPDAARALKDAPAAPEPAPDSRQSREKTIAKMDTSELAEAYKNAPTGNMFDDVRKREMYTELVKRGNNGDTEANEAIYGPLPDDAAETPDIDQPGQSTETDAWDLNNEYFDSETSTDRKREILTELRERNDRGSDAEGSAAYNDIIETERDRMDQDDEYLPPTVNVERTTTDELRGGVETLPDGSIYVHPGATDEEVPFTRTEPQMLPGEKFPPSRQQQDINDAAAAGLDVAVNAKAGTGKTTTLEGLARRMAGKKIVYVAFNKSVQVEADARMPDNVESRTGHSLAFRWAPRWMQNRSMGKGDKPLVRPADISKHLGIFGAVTKTDGKNLPNDRVARGVMKTVEAFSNSADDEINESHLPESLQGLTPEAKQKVVAWANKAWEDLTTDGGKLKVTPDHYRKLWALSRPDFSKAGFGGKAADIVFLDEAQDTPPVLAKVINDQNIQKIVVGDQDQAIYGFTGAVDYLAESDVNVRLPLNKSYRFGPAIADMGNRFLQVLGSRERVVGGGNPDSKIVDNIDAPDAILTRSNAGMLAHIVDQMEQGRKVGVPPKTKNDLLSLVDTVAGLKGERSMPNKMHDDLEAYDTWNEVEKEVAGGNSDDPKLSMIYRLFKDEETWRVRRYIDGLVEGNDGKTSADLDDPRVAIENFKKVEEGDKTFIEQIAPKHKVSSTFLQKEHFKAAGARWDSASKRWHFTGSKEQRDAKYNDAMQRVIDDYTPNMEFQADNTPDVVISTAHKSKGLEWKKVKIADDFRGPKTNEETGEVEMPEDEEMRLAYVAVTRAETELELGSLAWVLDYSDENGGVPEKREDSRDRTDLGGRLEDARERLSDKQHQENPDEDSQPTAPDDDYTSPVDPNLSDEDLIELDEEADRQAEEDRAPSDRIFNPRTDNRGVIVNSEDRQPYDENYDYSISDPEDGESGIDVTFYDRDGNNIGSGITYGDRNSVVPEDIRNIGIEVIRQHESRENSEGSSEPDENDTIEVPKSDEVQESTPAPERAPEAPPTVEQHTRRTIGDTLSDDEFDEYDMFNRDEKDEYVSHRNDGDDHRTASDKVRGNYEDLDDTYPDETDDLSDAELERKTDEIEQDVANSDESSADYLDKVKKALKYQTASRKRRKDRDRAPEAPEEVVEAPEPEPDPVPETNDPEPDSGLPDIPERDDINWEEKTPSGGVDGRKVIDSVLHPSVDKNSSLNPKELEHRVQLEYTLQNEDVDPRLLEELGSRNPKMTNLLQFMVDEQGAYRWWEHGDRKGSKLRLGDVGFRHVDRSFNKELGEYEEYDKWGEVIDLPTHSQPNVTIHLRDAAGNPQFVTDAKGNVVPKLARIHMNRLRPFEGFGSNGYATDRASDAESRPDVVRSEDPTPAAPEVDSVDDSAAPSGATPGPTASESGFVVPDLLEDVSDERFIEVINDSSVMEMAEVNGNIRDLRLRKEGMIASTGERIPGIADSDSRVENTYAGVTVVTDDSGWFIDHSLATADTPEQQYEAIRTLTENFGNITDGEYFRWYSGGREVSVSYNAETDSMVLFSRKDSPTSQLRYVGSIARSEFTPETGSARIGDLNSGGGYNAPKPVGEGFDEVSKTFTGLARVYNTPTWLGRLIDTQNEEWKNNFFNKEIRTFASGNAFARVTDDIPQSRVDKFLSDIEIKAKEFGNTLSKIGEHVVIAMGSMKEDQFSKHNAAAYVNTFLNPNLMRIHPHWDDSQHIPQDTSKWVHTNSATMRRVDKVVDYMMTHEFGHIIDSLTNRKDNGNRNFIDMGTVTDYRNNVFTTKDQEALWNRWKFQISQYGASNGAEGFAEAWAMWYHNGRGFSPASDAYADFYGWDAITGGLPAGAASGTVV